MLWPTADRLPGRLAAWLPGCPAARLLGCLTSDPRPSSRADLSPNADRATCPSAGNPSWPDHSQNTSRPGQTLSRLYLAGILLRGFSSHPFYGNQKRHKGRDRKGVAKRRQQTLHGDISVKRRSVACPEGPTPSQELDTPLPVFTYVCIYIYIYIYILFMYSYTHIYIYIYIYV